MKKITAAILILVIVLSMVACSKQETGEIALVTDLSSIDDKSFNQSIWEGLVAFCEDNEKTYTHYKAKGSTEEDRNEVIEKAIEDGSKIIVAAGKPYEVAVYNAQKKHLGTKFILIDGYPNDGAKKETKREVRENTVSIKFSEDQSGYLAGYSVVKDGYKKLGFIGGKELSTVVKYGQGFIKGAEAAAKEMGLKKPVQIKYNYMGNFDESKEALNLAKSWYSGGTEVIFSCGGLIVNSVISAANSEDGKVIGVDVDQSYLSDRIITSATKGLGAAINGMLFLNYDDKFPGGKEIILGAEALSVGLPFETSKFEKFTKKEYDQLLDKFAKGEVTVQVAETEAIESLSTDYVKVLVEKKK